MSIGEIIGCMYPTMGVITAAIWLVVNKDEGHGGYYQDDATKNFACLGLGIIWPISLSYLVFLLCAKIIEYIGESYRISLRIKREKAEDADRKLKCPFCDHPNDKSDQWCGFCGQKQIRSS